MILTIEVKTKGTHTEEDLYEFLQYQLGTGSCSPDNPFISEDGDAEIISIYP